MDAVTLDAFLQSARYAYAYLFYTGRTPAQRTFELRQVQVTGFYNFAVQRAMSRFFLELPRLDPHWTQTTIAGWDVLRPQSEIEERSEEHTSELQSLMRISYAVFCLKKKK